MPLLALDDAPLVADPAPDPAAPVGLDLDALRQHAYDNADGDIIVALLDLVSRQQAALSELHAAASTWVSETGVQHINSAVGRSRTRRALESVRSLLPRANG